MTRFRIYLLLVALLSFSRVNTSLWAQIKVSELEKSLQKNYSKDKKLPILLDLAKNYENRSFQKAIKYATLASKIAQELKKEEALSEAYEIMCRVFIAQDYYLRAQDFALKALKLYERQNNKLGKAAIYKYLSDIEMLRQEYERADSLLDRADKIYREAEDKIGQLDILISRSNLCIKQDEDFKAVNYLKLAMEISTNTEEKARLTDILVLIAYLYQLEENWEQSLDFYEKAQVIYHQQGNKVGFTKGQIEMGKIYLKLEETELAFALLNKGLASALSMKNQSQIQEASLALSYFYAQQGDYKQAFDQYRLSIATKDSLNNLQKERKMKALHQSYELEKREAEIALLNKDRQIQRYFILAFAVALCFSAILITVLFINDRKKKAANNALSLKNEEINQQKEEITTQAEQLKEANEEISHQRQKSEKLLLNVLPEYVAQELKEKGSTTPRHYDLATVIFTDFKGFTNIAEKMKPQDLIENLNYCFTAFDEICERHNIEKIKTIGDAYLAVGGIPEANTTNPEDAVKAGLEMIAFMEKWKSEKQLANETAWEIRIGVHSGELIAGVVGKNKFAYDVWGDTVNLAARMEQSGIAGKLNISEPTYQLVKDIFVCQHRGQIDAKNKGKIDMYLVEASS